MHLDELQSIIARQQAGWSLEQPFYLSPELFEFERRTWLARQWFVLGHSSEVSEPGCHIVRELLGESLIIVRDREGEVRGFYNVCRHRGSRICDQDGKGARLICPYHAWSYGLDGVLLSAPAMAEDFVASEWRLRPVQVCELGGIILVSLAGDPAQIEAIGEQARQMLEFHGIPDARIAARRAYPTQGNWKLVMENFLECYHCYPSHPEFCSVMKFVEVVAREASPQKRAKWEMEVETWLNEQADANSPVPAITSRFLDEGARFGTFRGPVGNGFKTASQDGEPVAPLMGRLQRFDGSANSLFLEPFVYLNVTSDHARLMHFLPVGPEQTDVFITWLVAGSATEDEVDVERMIWLWDVTTRQDKDIIERNAAGVRSAAYEPGPYSKLENMTIRYIQHYLQELSTCCQLSRE